MNKERKKYMPSPEKYIYCYYYRGNVYYTVRINDRYIGSRNSLERARELKDLELGNA